VALQPRPGDDGDDGVEAVMNQKRKATLGHPPCAAGTVQLRSCEADGLRVSNTEVQILLENVGQLAPPSTTMIHLDQPETYWGDRTPRIAETSSNLGGPTTIYLHTSLRQPAILIQPS
jgi:hypothetical protein